MNYKRCFWFCRRLHRNFIYNGLMGTNQNEHNLTIDKKYINSFIAYSIFIRVE